MKRPNCSSSQSFKNNILSIKKFIIIDKDVESLYALFGIWIMQTPLQKKEQYSSSKKQSIHIIFKFWLGRFYIKKKKCPSQSFKNNILY